MAKPTGHRRFRQGQAWRSTGGPHAVAPWHAAAQGRNVAWGISQTGPPSRRLTERASHEKTKPRGPGARGVQRILRHERKDIGMATYPCLRATRLVVGLSLATCAWAADIVVMGSTNRLLLKPNQPGQQVRLFCENRGTTDYTVLGGTFTVVIAPAGAATTPSPRITQVRLVGLEGSPLVASRLMQTDYPAPAGAWMSTVEALSFLPSRRVVIQPGSRWPLCDLVLDTTGIQETPTAWQVRFDGPLAGAKAKSFFNVPSDTDPRLTLEVPIAAEPTLLFLESNRPPEPPPVAVRLDPADGGLVFEADAGTGAVPAIEFCEDPVKGEWRSANISGTQVGAKWRWQMPLDPQVPARFFRSAFIPVGAVGGGQTAR